MTGALPMGAAAAVVPDVTREARVMIGAIVGYTDLVLEDVADRPQAVSDLLRIRAASEQLVELVTRLERMVEAAREEALIDPLTGLANRRALEARAAALFEAPGPASVLLFDLDRFKTINDAHGHLAGDAVLRAVAQRCRRAVRGADLVARFAGDEFVVLLPDTGSEGARWVADRVSRYVFGDPVRTERAIVPVEASVGLATRAPTDRGLADLLERADRAMYLDKEARVARGPRPRGARASSPAPPRR